MPPKKKSSTPKLSTPIEALRHADKRTNIPTEEKAPKSVLYPHDPSVDTRLVWKRKDEQD
jgi:adenine-specific DNA-methyltransferase